jgi:hypothetical protein
MGRNPATFVEQGIDGSYNYRYGIRQDDLLVELRGRMGMRRYRQMVDDDPTVGAVLAGITMLAKGATWTFKPKDKNRAEGAEFMTSVMDDMFFTMEDFLSDAMLMLPYGFMLFEMVLKRRSDGYYGVRKLGPRLPWTVDRFEVNEHNEPIGVWQLTDTGGSRYVPMERLLHFRAVSAGGDPYGRSILRNAYRSYVYVRHIQEYEAIAIERELNGLPVGRIPSDYLAPDAPDHKKAFVSKFKDILRDVKKNEQGFVLIPSDLWEDGDGKLSEKFQVDLELLASKGTRDIDPRKTINGHQQDMARSVLADFMTMGMNDRGSFSMSKNKSDIFVKAMKSFLNSVRAPVNRKLIPYLWQVNGFPEETMPELVYENLAPIDLDVLGKYIRSLALAGAKVFPNPDLENAAMVAADMPKRSVEEIEENYEEDDSAGEPADSEDEDPQTQADKQKQKETEDDEA